MMQVSSIMPDQVPIDIHVFAICVADVSATWNVIMTGNIEYHYTRLPASDSPSPPQERSCVILPAVYD